MVLRRRVAIWLGLAALIGGYVAFATSYLPLLWGAKRGVQYYFNPLEVITCSVLLMCIFAVYRRDASSLLLLLAFAVSAPAIWLGRYVLFFATRSIGGIIPSFILVGLPLDGSWSVLNWFQAVLYSFILYAIGTVAAAGVVFVTIHVALMIACRITQVQRSD